MKCKALVVIAYSILIIIGGVIGHIKAQSLPSLIMGIAFGTALLGCSIAMYKQNKLGYYIATALTLVLSAFFAFRFYKTLNFMPAGLMCILGIIVLATLIIPKSACCKSSCK